MYVPYGDPKADPPVQERVRQGEYGVGWLANR